MREKHKSRRPSRQSAETRSGWGGQAGRKATLRMALAVVLPALLMTAQEARADGINVEYVAVAGLVVLIPILLFQVLLEGILLAWVLKVRYVKTLIPLLLANVVSTLAGIPVKLVNSALGGALLPHDLAAYFGALPRVFLLGTLIYFLVTLATETLVIGGWFKTRGAAFTRGRLIRAVVLANVASYVVLAPLYYAFTRPKCDIRQFTTASAWAAKPPAEILYVEKPGKHLCSIMSDGSGRRELVLDAVEDYQIMPESGIVLYRNTGKELCQYRMKDAVRTVVCKLVPYQMPGMEQVAGSPDGQWVAYCIEEKGKCNLILFNTITGHSLNANVKSPDGMAWAVAPNTLLLNYAGRWKELSIQMDGIVTRDTAKPAPASVTKVFGRFSGFTWSAGFERGWGKSFPKDSKENVEVSTIPGLASRLIFTDNGKHFILADNPGLLHLARRIFNDVCILSNGREVIFDCNDEIYLLDVRDRKVGKIVSGSRFITLSTRYDRGATLFSGSRTGEPSVRR